MDFGHAVDWGGSEILKVESGCSRRLVSGAWFIGAHPGVVDRSGGGGLPDVYRLMAE